MQITSPPAGTGSGLFAGLFGAENGAGNGLFAMLMAVFGQSGQQGAGLPGSQPGAQTTGQNLPTSPFLQGLALSAGQAQTGIPEGAEAANGLTSLLGALQNLAENPSLPADIRSLLGSGRSEDLAALSQKLQAMDEEQRKAILGQLAALLQPVLPAHGPLPTPTQQDAVATADISPIESQQNRYTGPADILPASTPALASESPRSVPTDASGDQAENGLNTDKGRTQAALETSLQAQQERQSAHEHHQSRETGLVRALEQLQTRAGANEQANESRAQSQGLAALAAARESQPHTSSASHTTDNTGETGAISPTARPEAVQTRQAVRAAATAANISLKQDGNDLAANPADSQNPGATPAAAAPPLRMAEHLDRIQLNRTGAHLPVSEQVAVHLTRAAQSGQDHMTIRLQPAELGRIDIKLDISADGMVKASFQIDQPATLDLLVRDQRGLEKALGDAGLKTDGGSLNFNLRGDGQSQQQAGNSQNGSQQSANGQGQPGSASAGSESEMIPAGVLEMTWFVGPDRVDVRI